MKPPFTFPSRFASKVNFTDSCWLWTANSTAEGYGQYREGNRIVYAHRVAYELAVGPIPEGLHLDHLCRITSCVNPGHLEPVTPAENVRRAAKAKTHCRNGHLYNATNVLVEPSGKRRCRICRTRQQLSRHEARMAAQRRRRALRKAAA